MPNLEVYKTLHVPYARQGEAMLFIALAEYRISPKHENFEVTNVQNLDNAFEKVVAAFTDLSAKPSGKIAITREDWSGATDKIVKRMVKHIFKEVSQKHRKNRQKRLGDVTKHEEKSIELKRKASSQEMVVSLWLSKNYTMTEKRKDEGRARALFDLFKSEGDDHDDINLTTWGESMVSCGIHKTRLSSGCIYWGLKRKTPISNNT